MKSDIPNEASAPIHVRLTAFAIGLGSALLAVRLAAPFFDAESYQVYSGMVGLTAFVLGWWFGGRALLRRRQNAKSDDEANTLPARPMVRLSRIVALLLFFLAAFAVAYARGRFD